MRPEHVDCLGQPIGLHIEQEHFCRLLWPFKPLPHEPNSSDSTTRIKGNRIRDELVRRADLHVAGSKKFVREVPDIFCDNSSGLSFEGSRENMGIARVGQPITRREECLIIFDGRVLKGSLHDHPSPIGVSRWVRRPLPSQYPSNGYFGFIHHLSRPAHTKEFRFGKREQQVALQRPRKGASINESGVPVSEQTYRYSASISARDAKAAPRLSSRARLYENRSSALIRRCLPTISNVISPFSKSEIKNGRDTFNMSAAC